MQQPMCDACGLDKHDGLLEEIEPAVAFDGIMYLCGGHYHLKYKKVPSVADRVALWQHWNHYHPKERPTMSTEKPPWTQDRSGFRFTMRPHEDHLDIYCEENPRPADHPYLASVGQLQANQDDKAGFALALMAAQDKLRLALQEMIKRAAALPPEQIPTPDKLTQNNLEAALELLDTGIIPTIQATAPGHRTYTVSPGIDTTSGVEIYHLQIEVPGERTKDMAMTRKELLEWWTEERKRVFE